MGTCPSICGRQGGGVSVVSFLPFGLQDYLFLAFESWQHGRKVSAYVSVSTHEAQTLRLLARREWPNGRSSKWEWIEAFSLSRQGTLKRKMERAANDTLSPSRSECECTDTWNDGQVQVGCRRGERAPRPVLSPILEGETPLLFGTSLIGTILRSSPLFSLLTPPSRAIDRDIKRCPRLTKTMRYSRRRQLKTTPFIAISYSPILATSTPAGGA